MNDDSVLEVLKEIRNWTRATSYLSVKSLLQQTLANSKSRVAYQMFDGATSIEQVRLACKISPNSLNALAQRCTSMGLMEVSADKKRLRLFDLADFGMIDESQRS